MSELERITVKYVELEDRIRLTGETSHGAVIAVWITRRLLDRTLPALVQSLETSIEASRGDSLRTNALQSFAQHAARSGLTPQSPVRASARDVQWLAQAIDVTITRSDVHLSLRGADSQRVSLTLQERKLRQFLNILHDVYRRADWPTNGWPQWACSPSFFGDAGAARVH